LSQCAHRLSLDWPDSRTSRSVYAQWSGRISDRAIQLTENTLHARSHTLLPVLSYAKYRPSGSLMETANAASDRDPPGSSARLCFRVEASTPTISPFSSGGVKHNSPHTPTLRLGNANLYASWGRLFLDSAVGTKRGSSGPPESTQVPRHHSLPHDFSGLNLRCICRRQA